MDAAGQELAVPVEVAQHGGDGERLEGGAEGEAFVGAVGDGAARTDVVPEHAQPGAVFALQGGEAAGHPVGGVRGTGPEDERGGGGGGE